MGDKQLIQLTPGDDYGVYVSGYRNNINTPLAYRGPYFMASNLNVELRGMGGFVTLIDGRTGEAVTPAFQGFPYGSV